MTETIGYIASLLFAFCGLPQAIKCWKEGHARGVSSLMIGMWLGGEVLMTYYVIMKHGMDLPLLLNYVINTVFVLIILRYKIKERI